MEKDIIIKRIIEILDKCDIDVLVYIEVLLSRFLNH